MVESAHNGRLDVYIQDQLALAQLMTNLETFFGSSRFSRDPRDFKPKRLPRNAKTPYKRNRSDQ